MKPNAKVGLILIGDELLSGSRQDKHMNHIIELLKQRQMALSWVRIVGDERALLLDTLRDTMNGSDIVFSFGGIGATPDDRTRECAASALGVKQYIHPQLKAILEEEFGDAAYPNRIRMADLPDGATLIPNPVNRIAGFKVMHHHFVPGFPTMAWPMVEWVLDTHYRFLHGSHVYHEKRWILKNMPESDLIPIMESLLEQFPGVSLSSLPSTTERLQIDFGLKGKAEHITQASAWLETRFSQAHICFQPQVLN